MGHAHLKVNTMLNGTSLDQECFLRRQVSAGVSKHFKHPIYLVWTTAIQVEKLLWTCTHTHTHAYGMKIVQGKTNSWSFLEHTHTEAQALQISVHQCAITTKWQAFMFVSDDTAVLNKSFESWRNNMLYINRLLVLLHTGEWNKLIPPKIMWIWHISFVYWVVC